MNEVEEIKQRIDLVDLISQYVTLKKAGANFKGSCPFHQEKTASFMVSPQKQIWKCFGCGKGGDHYKFVMETEHLEFGDALKLLADKAGVTLQPRTKAEHQTRDKKETLFAINRLSAKVFQKILLEQSVAEEARQYLKKRGLSEEIIKKFGIGFAPRKFNLRDFLVKRDFLSADIAKAGNPDKFFDRVMFPIFDVLGNIVAFTGRVLGDAQPKYLNSPETPLYNKSRIIYGLNFAKGAIKEKNYVVLVEGQMDVAALHQHGAEQAVASSGTAITLTQLQALSKYTHNFLLAFDNDTAGKTTTKKVIEMLLGLDMNMKVIDFGSYKDAGEMLERNGSPWAEAVKSAQEGVDWWISEEIAAAGNLNFIENKKQVVSSMLPILRLVEDPTRLDHYAQRLAVAAGVKVDSIYLSLDKTTTPNSATVKSVAKGSEEKVYLTNEEQLLAVVLARPDIGFEQRDKFESIVWQSKDATLIAAEVKKRYNVKTLTKNQSQFLSQVKSSLDPQLGGKIDSWQFWLESQWSELSDSITRELIEEKYTRLATKDYERRKEDLATQIKRAQEQGDLVKVKELMKTLSDVAKERG